MIPILPVNKETFKIAGQAIRDGKIICLPTATIYILACSVFCKDAIAKIRAMRNSPEDKPLTVVMSKSQIKKYALLTSREQKIIEVLLPSPVCVYVNKKNNKLDLAVTYSDFLCVYWQESEVADLFYKAKTILAITSANMMGLAPAQTVKEAVNYFGDKVDLYIDGGKPRGKSASAHIDIRKEPVELRRAAAHFPFEKVQSILKEHGLK
jgi:L-threonylcarbamoyladenylate synthase